MLDETLTARVNNVLEDYWKMLSEASYAQPISTPLVMSRERLHRLILLEAPPFIIDNEIEILNRRIPFVRRNIDWDYDLTDFPKEMMAFSSNQPE